MSAGVVDWSGLNRLGVGLAAGLEQSRTQDLASLMGAKVSSGDYAGAAKTAFDAGDLQTGLKLVALGEDKKSTADFQSMLGGAGGIAGILGGGTPAPATPAQPVAPAGGLPSFTDASGPAGSYLATLRGVESNGNRLAKNPNSSATGIDQFTKSTWDGLRTKYPELGLTPDGRTDVAQSTRAMERFTRDNANVLTNAGVPITPGNLYVAHFLGAGGAARFIRGTMNNPDAPATAFVDPSAAAANRTIFYNRDGSPKSAGAVYAERTSKFGGATPPAAVQAQNPSRVRVASADPSFVPQAASPANGASPSPAGPTMAIPDDPVPAEQRVQVAQAAPQVFQQAGLNPQAAAQLQATQPGSRARVETIIKFMSHPKAPEGFKDAMKAALANEFAIDKENRSMSSEQKEYAWDVANGFKGDPMAWRAAKAAATRAPEGDTATMREYALAKSQGFTGDLFEYKRKLAEAGSTKVSQSVNGGAEGEQDKVVQKDLGEFQVKTRNADQTAQTALSNIRVMKQLIEDPTFYSGTFGSLATEGKKALASFGIGAADSARANEGFTKLSAQSILDKAGGSLGAQISNGDRTFIESTAANINNTPAGNRLILEMAERLALRAQKVHEMMVEYKARPENKGRIDDRFLSQVNRFVNDNPVFAGLENMASAPEVLKAPRSGPPPGQRDASVRQSAQPRAIPAAGTVEDGYTFLGGNPSDPKSWRKN